MWDVRGMIRGGNSLEPMITYVRCIWCRHAWDLSQTYVLCTVCKCCSYVRCKCVVIRDVI